MESYTREHDEDITMRFLRIAHHAGTCCALVLSLSLLPLASGQEKEEKKDEKKLPAAAQKEVDYAKDIEPILTRNCVKCHGDNKQKSSFRLDTREALLKGGEVGKSVVIGKSAESPMIHYVAHTDPDIKMPPESAKLSDQEIGLLRAWIDQGLKWVEKPAEHKPKGPDLKVLKGQTKWVTSLVFAPGGKVLATAGGDTLLFKPGEVKLWDVNSGEVKASFDGHERTVWSVAFDREGKTLASAGYDRLVKLWDVSSAKERATLSGHSNWVTGVTFSPNGQVLATGSEDTTAKLWDVAGAKELATLKGHTATVRGLTFSPDGKLLATASFDQTVKLWDVEKRAELATLKGHSDAVWAVAFSRDGKTLASAGADGALKVWKVPELKDGKLDGAVPDPTTLQGHKNWISSLAFSPDGTRLVSGGFDNSVKVWNLERGREVASLDGLKSTVWSVAFTADGKTVALAFGAVAGEESTVKFWDYPPKEERKY
jgi:WD40 repeat protein